MKIKSLLFMLITLALSTNVYGASYAYLFNNNEIIKLNLSTNSITNVTISISPAIGYLNVPAFVDANNNHLFVFYGDMSEQVGLAVFNAQTLQLEKNMGTISANEDGYLPYIIIPPIGNVFYLKWVTADFYTENTASYNSQTLDRISINTNFPIPNGEYLGYSKLGDKLFGIDLSTGSIYVYDANTFTQTANYSIQNIFIRTDTGGAVEDFENNILLIARNSALDPSSTSNTDVLYAYNVVSKQLMSKINTGVESNNMKLTPNGDMIIYSETKPIFHDNYYTANDTGRIHIYNTLTGEQITTVSIPTNGFCNIIGISPDSSNVYLIVKIPNSSQYELAILNLNTFKITNIIQNIFATMMVFF